MLDQLFRDSAAALERYFTRRHGEGTHVHDLVQETFLQLARGLERGLQPGSPRGYLFGVARRVSLAAWREQSQQPTPFQDHDQPIQPVAPPDERVEAVREAIAGMEPLQREVLDLRFVQCLSYEEIAQALGVPLGTVRSRLHYSIKQVRQKLDIPTPHPLEKIP